MGLKIPSGHNHMFEQLLKTLPSRQPSREGTGIAGKRIGNDRRPLSSGWDEVVPTADDGWDSPKNSTHLPSLNRGDSMQTPAFLNRLGGLGLQIDEFEQQSERMGGQIEASGSERQSQVLSINDLNAQQFHPMILSNINNNFKTSMDRLLLMRIRNFVSDLRQTHQELKEYVEDQRTITEYFQEKLCLEVEDFFIEFRNRLQAAAPQPVHQSQLNDLEELLRQRNSEVQTLAREISELRTTLEKQQQKNRSLRKVTKKQQPCLNCRTLQSRLSAMREESVGVEQRVEKLVAENQSLQEYLFDIEQKIVGIDLEVEKRLKERTKELQEGFGQKGGEQYLEQIQQLSEEIQHYAQKCRKLETALQQKEQEIAQKLHRNSRIEEAEQTLQRKEASLKDSISKMQEQKQLNYVRQHQILMAQQNLSKKIEDIRKKEMELSQWQVQLAKKANQARQIHKDNTLSQQFPDEASYGNSVDDLNRSDEMSLKSFGRHNKNYAESKFQGSPNSVENLNQYHHQGNHAGNRQPTQYELDFKGQGMELPLREQRYNPIEPQRYERERPREREREDRFAVPRRNDSKKIVDSTYVPRSREHAIDNTTARGFGVGTGSQYRDNRQTSPYRNGPEGKLRATPTPHQYNLPRTSPNHYRDASKNSRSSATKTNYTPLPHPHPVPGRGPRQPAQLTGLGSKLQRLREQIKKEIDSIK